jgi:hypothetical protein
VDGKKNFEAAKRAISLANERESRLVDPFLSVLPVEGASLSVLVSPGQATVSSSNATAARIDELQFDLGEGPCWDAMTTRRPVLRPDFALVGSDDWPLFTEGVRRDGIHDEIGAIYAFPLYIGSLDLGAVDLYSNEPRELKNTEVKRVSKLAELASWQVLRRIIGDDGTEEDLSPLSRREVHQATGMVLAQLNISANDAMLLLRAHAFSSGRSVMDVAADVVERRLDFSPGRSPGAGE